VVTFEINIYNNKQICKARNVGSWETNLRRMISIYLSIYPSSFSATTLLVGSC